MYVVSITVLLWTVLQRGLWILLVLLLTSLSWCLNKWSNLKSLGLSTLQVQMALWCEEAATSSLMACQSVNQSFWYWWTILKRAWKLSTNIICNLLIMFSFLGGTCPVIDPTMPVGVCGGELCETDENCSDGKICCASACGGSMCVMPQEETGTVKLFYYHCPKMRWFLCWYM